MSNVQKVDELFEQLFASFHEEHQAFHFPVVEWQQAGEENDEIMCIVDLKQFEKEDISIRVDTSQPTPMLTIRAKKKVTKEAAEKPSTSEQNDQEVLNEKEVDPSQELLPSEEISQESALSQKEELSPAQREEEKNLVSISKHRAMFNISLPELVDPTTIKASLVDGKLCIRMKTLPSPVTEHVIPIE